MDEVSGRKILDDDRVPADVRVLGLNPVGNYAVEIRWSDGHDTGIYPFDRLRAMCERGQV